MGVRYVERVKSDCTSSMAIKKGVLTCQLGIAFAAYKEHRKATH